MKQPKDILLYSLSAVVMLLLNIGFVSIELYKADFSEPLVGKAEITHAEFTKLESLTHYATVIETAFITLAIGFAVMIFLKRNRPKVKSFNLFLIVSLLILEGANMAVAWLADAPLGNLTQMFYIPLMTLFGVYIYLLITEFSSVRKESRSDF